MQHFKLQSCFDSWSTTVSHYWKIKENFQNFQLVNVYRNALYQNISKFIFPECISFFNTFSVIVILGKIIIA